ncbi:28S ribosomal protein S18b, mitochondrial [Orussus abietinus]|uniref:28S ribosomal protein S18b, mitochondrial n=1 Tax=Orussus abietinus TaxID=222816 RepID=UPI0006257CB4|nr:28S ribosomal protein S18b, mitochondrial [Orussus abietinus]
MSIVSLGLHRTVGSLWTGLINKGFTLRNLSVTNSFRSAEAVGQIAEEGDGTSQREIDPSKDRTRIIPVETSIRYLESKAYKETYGSNPVWKLYRRNHKGQIPPQKTRKLCIRNGVISTGSPCPICRDEYLILDYRNVKLLKQFISEYNGEILSYQKTGICQRKYRELLVAIYKAKDFGTITFDVPLRYYDYSEWYKPDCEDHQC